MRTLLILIFIFFLGSPGITQDTQSRWLNWERLSITFGAAYYYSPWESYNNVVDLLARQISLDTYFYEPRGAYDRINGDMPLKMGLNYEVFTNFTIGLTGQYESIAAEFEIYSDATVPPKYLSWLKSYRQQIVLNMYSYGFEFNYSKPVANNIGLFAGLCVDLCTADLIYKSGYKQGEEGPIGSEFPDIRVTMDDQNIGVRYIIGTELKVSDLISVRFAATYRQLSFDQIRGDGYERFSYDTIHFEAELAESSNYFGPKMIRVTSPGYEDYYQLFYRTFQTNPDHLNGANLNPAKIDLNAFAIQAEIKIEL
jgi:hypothetical protein